VSRREFVVIAPPHRRQFLREAGRVVVVAQLHLAEQGIGAIG
jgi:hypothetical protein